MRKRSKYYLSLAMIVMAMLFIGSLTTATAGVLQPGSLALEHSTDLACGPWVADWTGGFTTENGWFLWVGTCDDTTDFNGCGQDLYNSGFLPTGTTSVTVSGLPEDGSTLWITLWALVGGNWVPVAHGADQAASNCDGNPGDSCGTGLVYDCLLNCIDDGYVQNWPGDGVCDDGSSINLDCSEFGYDGGDCLGSIGHVCDYFDIGDGVIDCSLNCSPASYPGDNFCDDGPTWDFMCPEFNFDEGDCIGNSCGADMVYDCVSNCVDGTDAQDWIGDGTCDDGTWGIVLTCPEFNNDGGDCDTGPAITSPPDFSELSCNINTTVSWSANGAAVTGWWLWAGPCDNPAFNNCGDDYYNSGSLPGGTTSVTILASALPTDGSTVYVRLFAQMNGTWTSVDLNTYTAASNCDGNPGDSCGSGMVFDCLLNCIDDGYVQNWPGDGVCDDGSSINLDCSEFGYDGGDCLGSIGHVCDYFDIGDGVIDCSLNCSPASYPGDNFCDDGPTWDFMCPEFNFDEGDCIGNSCGADMVYDCVSNCVDGTDAQDWIGDGTCDDGTWGIVLTCPEFNNDGGDCDTGPAITSPPDFSELSCNINTTVSWSANGAAVTGWWLWAGPCDNPAFNNCGDDYYNSGSLPGGTTSVTILASALPTDGSTVYVRLFAQMNGTWTSVDLNTYTAASGCGGGDNPGDSCGDDMVFDCSLNCVDEFSAQAWIGDNYCDDGSYGIDLTCSAFADDDGDCNGIPRIVYPENSVCSNDTIGVDDGGAAVSQYWLWAGPCNNPAFNNCGDDFFNSGALGANPAETNIVITGLPNDGSTVWLRLWYNLGGSWNSVVYEYETCTGAPVSVNSAPHPKK